MNIITNPEPIDIVIPSRLDIDAYDSPLVTVWQNYPVTVFDSPDFAYDTIVAALSKMRYSLKVMIYQITNDDMCEWLLKLGTNSGVSVDVRPARLR